MLAEMTRRNCSLTDLNLSSIGSPSVGSCEKMKMKHIL